jgi:2-aminoethylphosphonate-pyruvate transaminase
MEEQVTLAIETRDKALFTPGPLTTSATVKAAMLRDLGSRDFEFMAAVEEIRERLLDIAEATGRGYEAIPMQGSGTFGIESVMGSVTPPEGKWVIVVNGAYGERMAQMARRLGIASVAVAFPENEPAAPFAVDMALLRNTEATHVGVVHCETTTGLLNPVQEIARLARIRGKSIVVDAMSSFGAVPLPVADWDIDFLVSSSNKCIEGVPGFSFAIAKRERLEAANGYARSLALDLVAQWRALEAHGQFRFTPPTHAMLAFRQALRELAAEGGVAGRAARYRRNYETLIAGMRQLGFAEYLRPEDQGYIITSFRYPQHPGFSFERFYESLHENGFVIYPGKVSDAACFRIGTIGRIVETDVKGLLAAIKETLTQMEVTL